MYNQFIYLILKVNLSFIQETELMIPHKKLKQLKDNNSTDKLLKNEIKKTKLSIQEPVKPNSKSIHCLIKSNSKTRFEKQGKQGKQIIYNFKNIKIGAKKSKSKIKTENNSIRESRQQCSQGLGWTELDKVKYELVIERRTRQSLQKQIEVLKKQIIFLNNFGTSMRNSMNAKRQYPQEKTHKDKILNRLIRKRQGGVGSENQNDSTGIHSAKTHLDQKIVELYQQYTTKKVIPNIESLYELSKNYFHDFQTNYSKIVVLFNLQKQENRSIFADKLNELLSLFNVPIVKPNSKQLNLTKSKEKQKSIKQSFTKHETICSQFSLPETEINQKITNELKNLLFLTMSNQLSLKKFIMSQTYAKLMEKVRELQHQ